jgi:hypothetical protein
VAIAQPLEEKPKVMIRVDAGEESLRSRLQQEMEVLGLEVDDSGSVDAKTDVELEAQARRLGAIAIVSVSTADGGKVEMTIIDRATGKTVHRQLVGSTKNDPAAAELIAIRTIELLRASLMEIKSPHPSRGEVEVTPRIEALAYVPVSVKPSADKTVPPKGATSPTFETISLFTGASVNYTTGWGIGSGFRGGAATYLLGPVGVQGDVTIPLEPLSHEGARGTAFLDITEFSFSTHYDIRRPGLVFSSHVGTKICFMKFEGHAVPPYVSENVNLRAYGGFVSAGLSLRLYRRWYFRLEQSVSVLVPNTIVRFGGERAATLGQPLGATALSVEVRLP